MYTWIDSIRVSGIDRIRDFNTFNDDVPAIHRMDTPHRRIDQIDIRNLNIFRGLNLD